MEDWEIVEDSQKLLILEMKRSPEPEPPPPPPESDTESESDEADKIIEQLEIMVKESKEKEKLSNKEGALLTCFDFAKQFDWRLNAIYMTFNTVSMLYKNRSILLRLYMTAQISYKTFVFYNSLWKKHL